jgi:FtsP/CotA-like multicopper oxidase with cupredoxin domain
MRWSRKDNSPLVPDGEFRALVLRRAALLTVALAVSVTLSRYVSGLVTGWAELALDTLVTIPVAAAAVWAACLAARLLGDHLTARAATAALVSLVCTLLFTPLAALLPLLHGILDGTAPLGVDLVAALRESTSVQPAVFATALVVCTAGIPVPLAHRRRLSFRLFTIVAVAVTVLAQFTGPSVVFPAVANAAQDDDGASSCGTAPRRTFSVYAINVDITVDRFGDHDPFGFMYVLAGALPAVRAQEAALKEAAAVDADPNGAKVSSGLGKDPIQPLVLRARLGECVVITLTNRLTNPPRGGPGFGDPFISTQPGGVPAVSIDMAGVPYNAAGGAGGQAVGNNPTGVMVPPGGSYTYQYYLDPLTGEGAKVFRSGGNSTQLTAHGLFGALVAEPADAKWLDPETGADRTDDAAFNSFSAIIQRSAGVSFREFAIMYHEIGDEMFNLRRPAREDGGDTNCFDDPDGLGAPLPMLDEGGIDNCGTDTDDYRPAGRALNYRSEPFFRRQELLVQQRGADDSTLPASESLMYSSYTNGDPATPMPRSYLGEPTKTRLIDAGFEQLHVHHLHGGGDRWPQNPAAQNSNFASGLQKRPPNNTPSINLDSQSIGPVETYNLEHECGAGGCQQAVGDFLYHCHIAQHYIAGMFGIWRVFDTRQSDLAVIPGRAAPPNAVTSQFLLGLNIGGKTVVPRAGLNNPATQIAVEDLVEGQIPPQGARFSDTDATVWDWQKAGTPAAPLYLAEPEDTTVWQDYTSPTPGARNPILFNPRNGRPAYPLMRPHLGMRPPFSPAGHSGTPYLGNTTSTTRPDGLCPANSTVRKMDVTAIAVPIKETARETDTEGEVYVLNQDKDKVLADANSGAKAPDPLVIRSNVGDCVALTLTSELDPAVQPKVNMHTHFVQFDPQGSDGVITGYNYEQSVYPDQLEQRTATAGTSAGATRMTVTNTTNLRTGISIGVGVGRTGIEIRRITAITGTTLTFDSPLGQPHSAGEPVSVEFVQYRWYSDVDSGTVFWHDHVNGIKSWAHGLFGAHIIEPVGSTYHDPKTGAVIQSGTIADIHTTGPVGVGVRNSFREFAIFLGNGRQGRPELDNPAFPGPLSRDVGQECEEGFINLRAAPLGERTPPGATPANPATTQQRQEFNGGVCRNAFSNAKDPTGQNTAAATVTSVDPYAFSSVKYGDPATPLLRAYAGDPVVVRTVGLNERTEALRLQGSRFRRERFNADGELVDAATTGISERFDYVLDGGAGMPGDYLYYSTRNFAFESGAWGIFRVHDRIQSDLKPLPDRTAPPTGAGFPVQRAATGDTQRVPGPNPAPATQAGVVTSTRSPCAAQAPVRSYDVTVFDRALPTAPTRDVNGVIYALTSDVAAIRAGAKRVEPLVIRANQGDCVRITLRDQLPAGSLYGGTRAGFDLGKLPYNPQTSAGTAVGLNPDTTVASGQSIAYEFAADKLLGTAIFQNLGSVASIRHGAYGLLVVEPAGSSWFASADNRPLGSTFTSAQAIIRSAGGNFREFALTMGTTDQQYARSIVQYQDVVAGTGVNSVFTGNDPVATRAFNNISYGSAPLTTRLGLTSSPPNPSANYGGAFSSIRHGDPATPVFVAKSGDPVVFRIGIGASDQFSTFSVGGHSFPQEPYLWNGTTDKRSQLLQARSLTAGETMEAELVGSSQRYTGDYLYGDTRQPFTEAGMWGLLRVLPTSSTAVPGL